MTHTTNYRILVVIAFLQGMVFYGPVATLYRRAYGLDIQGLFLIESISWVATIILEAPWGRFADRYGYRLTLLIGNAVFLGSKLVFAAASGFSGFLVERLALSVSLAALSGCSEAMVYRSAGPVAVERAFGRWNAASGAGLFLAAIVSPLLYSISLRAAAYGTIVPYAAAFFCSLFLVDLPEAISTYPAAGSAARGLRAALVSLAGDKRLLLFLSAAAVAGEAGHAATVFLAPLQYERSGIPVAAFGLLFAILQGAGLAAAGSGRLSATLGRGHALKALLLLESSGLATLAVSTSGVVSVVALVVVAVAVAMFRPLSSAFQNERVKGAERATALSVNAMVVEMAAAAVNIFVGRAAAAGLPVVFGFLAVAVAMLSSVVGIADRQARYGPPGAALPPV
jgi:MFS family permease